MLLSLFMLLGYSHKFMMSLDPCPRLRYTWHWVHQISQLVDLNYGTLCQYHSLCYISLHPSPLPAGGENLELSTGFVKYSRMARCSEGMSATSE